MPGPRRSLPDATELMRILDAIPDVLFWCRYDERTATSRIEWCNDTVVEVTGMTREEIIGLRPGDLLPPNVLSDSGVRRSFYERARALGVHEFDKPVLFGRGDKDRYMRVRVVWVDPADIRVLIMATPVEADDAPA
jgi:PAS domain-containing protein